MTPDRPEITIVRLPLQQTHLGHAAAAILGILLVVLTSGCGGGGASMSQVANAAGANSCDNSGYYLIIKTTGEKDTIYDCAFAPDNQMRCVTYANGIANDATAAVRLVFSTTLGPGKPPCLAG